MQLTAGRLPEKMVSVVPDRDHGRYFCPFSEKFKIRSFYGQPTPKYPLHKDIPNQRSVKKESPTIPQPEGYAVPEDFLTIRPDDSPGIKRLKRLASLDSTQLENLPEDLKPKRK